MVERFAKFSFDIAEIYHYWHKISTSVMTEYGLKGSNAVYIIMLYQYAEGLTSTQLAEYCSRDKADVSRTINLMEAKGFVRRETQNQKTYRARMILTEEGKRIAENIHIRVKAAMEKGGKGLSEEERKTFYYALDLIASNMQKIAEEGLL